MPADREPPALAAHRRELLLSELAYNGYLHTSEMAASLGVSEMTIRRDIDALARRGQLTRVHGGATLGPAPERTGQTPRSPGGQRTVFTFGMVVPTMEYYYAHVIEGARAAASRLRSRLEVRGSTYSATDNLHHAKALVQSGTLDGLAIAATMEGEGSDELYDWLCRLRLPVVLLERAPRPQVFGPRPESVTTDHALGMRKALKHLAEQGHHNIALMLDPTPTAPHLRRGWEEGLSELGLVATIDEVAIGFNDPDRDERIAAVLADVTRTQTTAIVIHSDPHAMAFAQYCHDHGVKVPAQLAVVAYDDELSYLCSPPLTAVRPPKQHVGRMCVELLAGRVHDPLRPPHRVVIEPELVIRSSSVRP